MINTTASIRNVLSIAGSDPSGGAGLQGDLKTFAALRVFGCAVPTALTAQNTRGISGVWPVPAQFVVRQLEALFDDIEIHAVKIGMLANADIVHGVCKVLERYHPQHVVLDPVLRASTGGTLLDKEGLEAVLHALLPLVSVVTPNAIEAGVLLGDVAPVSADAAEKCAQRLCALGAKAVLITGGHLHTEVECVDVLLQQLAVRRFRTRRVQSGGTHGTGCAHSSAIAALLAKGESIAGACEGAQRFVAASIAHSLQLRVGAGVGPLHALGELWGGPE